jgi:peptide/nickel transport system substrate-binding protein
MLVDNPNSVAIDELMDGYLLRADDRGRLIPDMAIRVPTVQNGDLSRDAKTIVYHLRRGVTWSDGAPFTAKDVVFSFQAAMDPRINVPDRSGFEDVAQVRARDDYTVQVHLARPYSPALETFFALSANVPYPILPAHEIKSLSVLQHPPFDAHNISLGPYRLVRWARGDRLVFEANPHYWRGPPKIARIDVPIVPDQTSEFNLFRTGAIDLTGLTGDVQLLQEMQKLPNVRIQFYDLNFFLYITLQMERPVFRDIRVRQAIVAALDRPALMRRYRGVFYTRGDGDRLPGAIGFDPTLRQPPYDPARAAALLDAAGWTKHGAFREKNGERLTLDLVTTPLPAPLRGSLLLQAALRQVGIDVRIRTLAVSVLDAPLGAGGTLAAGQFDIFRNGWLPGGVDDDSYLWRCDTRPPQGENYGRICDADIDRWAKTALASTDPVVQATMYRNIQRRLVRDTDVIFLGFSRGAYAARSNLAGFRPSRIGRSFWNPWEWHWTR